MVEFGFGCRFHDLHYFKVGIFLYSSGGSLPLVLCNHVRTKGIFMGAISLLIWILKNPLSLKKNTSPNIQHPIGNYQRQPRLFQMMLNYL